jgi:hypothetical protein
MVYSANRVLTVKELRSGDIMHCGMTAGKCMAWTVKETDTTYAYVKVGSSMVKMTGKDIRNGLPMYRAKECPFCSLGQARTKPPTPKENVTFTSRELIAADVSSALSGVDNVRAKSNAQRGGAAITSRKKYVNARTQQIVDQLLRSIK